MLTTQQVKEWSQKCGPSFYLLDLDVALHNYRHLLSAGRAIYAPFGIAYSVKTNYTPALCKALSQEGALLEVVSEMEYEMALKTGHKPENMVVNGPVHSEDFMSRVMLEGAVINFDSWYQIDFLEKYAKENPEQKVQFGLRLMLDISSCTPSRFGFPVDKITLTKLRDRLKNLPNANLVSLHCHFCEGARDAGSYSFRAQEMIRISDEFFHDFPVHTFNLGGGLYSKMPDELKDQFQDNIPELEVYADSLCQPFANRFHSKKKPQLLIEPGNALVADAMQFYCPVTDIKHAGNRVIALLDGSIFDIKPTRNQKNLPLQILPMNDKNHYLENCDFTGFTCLEDDVMYRGFTGQLAIGDYAVFGNTGAYTNVLRPPFIRPAAAIIAKKGEELFLVKNADDLDFVLQSYIV